MRLVSIVLVALLVPTTAAAQNRGIFVDAGALLGIRFTPSAEGDPSLFSPSGSFTYEWNDLGQEGILLPSSLLRQKSKGRVAAGGSAAIGVFLSPSVSLRLEGAFHGEYATTMETSSLLSTTDLRQAAAIWDFAAATAWHQGLGRRVTMAYLGGVVFRRQQDKSDLSFQSTFRNTISPIFGSLASFPSESSYQQEFTSTSYTTGVMAGVEAIVNVSRHFAIVPQVRMVAANGDWNLRPAIVMRWHP